MNTFKKRWGMHVVATLMLAACGSGGGGSEGAPPNDPELPATSISITGSVVDAPIKQATVCLDLNANNLCDAGEPYALSDVAGAFTMTATITGTVPVLAIGGVNTATQEPHIGFFKTYVSLDKDVPTSVGNTLSPLSTLAAASYEYQRAYVNDYTYDEAKVQLASKLGLSVSELLANPSETSLTYAKTQQLMQTVKLYMETLTPGASSVPNAYDEAAFLYAKISQMVMNSSQSNNDFSALPDALRSTSYQGSSIVVSTEVEAYHSALMSTIQNKNTDLSNDDERDRFEDLLQTYHESAVTAIQDEDYTALDTQMTTLQTTPTSTLLASVNIPPVISGTPSVQVDVLGEYLFVPTVTDPESDSLTFSLLNQPDWMLFNASTGVLSGSPQADDAGLYENIILQVSDGTNSVALDAFSIMVNTLPPVNNDEATISGLSQRTSSANMLYTFEGVSDLSGLQWEFAVTPEVPITSTTDPVAGTCRVSLEDVSTSEDYNLTLRAIHSSGTFEKRVQILSAFKYLDPTPEMTLHHAHDNDRSSYTSMYSRNGYSRHYTGRSYYLYDDHGFIKSKIQLPYLPDFDRFFNYSGGPADLEVHDAVNGKVYSVVNDKKDYDDTSATVYSGDVGLFALDIASGELNYKVIKTSSSTNKFGRWNFIHYGDHFYMVRSILNESLSAPTTTYPTNDIEIVKMDFAGNVLGSKHVDSSYIQGFGYASSSVVIENLRLNIHNNDLIVLLPVVSGWYGDDTSNYDHLNDLYLPITLDTFALKTPFWPYNDNSIDWIYNQGYINFPSRQPVIYNWMFSYGYSGGVLSGYITPTDGNDGWLKGTLSSDYSSFDLGFTYLVDFDENLSTFDYRWDYSTSIDNEFKAMEKPDVIYNDKPEYIIHNDVAYQLPGGDCDFNGQSLAVSNSCKGFDGFVFESAQGLTTRTLPTGFVTYAYAPYGNNITLTKVEEYDDYNRYVTLELNEDGLHPGCILAQEPLQTYEAFTAHQNTTLIKETTPTFSTMNVEVNSQESNVTITPMVYRAPLLCSDYKVSVDQRLVTYGTTAVSARLHQSYTLTLITPPVHGVFDVDTKTYQADIDFVGEDELKVMIDDGTGTQEVIIKITVL